MEITVPYKLVYRAKTARKIASGDISKKRIKSLVKKEIMKLIQKSSKTSK